jgi:hypothetical protein
LPKGGNRRYTAEVAAKIGRGGFIRGIMRRPSSAVVRTESGLAAPVLQ